MLLYNSKYTPYVLNQNSGNGGHGVDVVFGVVVEVDARHEVEIFEDSVQALTDAGVEIAQWGVGIDEQDGMIGGGVGHWGVV